MSSEFPILAYKIIYVGISFLNKKELFITIKYINPVILIRFI